MSKSQPEEVTQLLLDWSNGNRAALDRLFPLVHAELHRLASRYMAKERHGHTLQTSALVNEAYLRLVDQRRVQWQNRAHFFAIASQLMRRIVVDHARAHAQVKRGGGAQRVSLENAAELSLKPASDLIALDDALESLAAIDPRRSRVVELRFFGGLSVEETAETLKVSTITVMRDWKLAKAYLYRAIRNAT
jgi:RNA polymerase sigma-70 factor (ECF subfamily)